MSKRSKMLLLIGAYLLISGMCAMLDNGGLYAIGITLFVVGQVVFIAGIVDYGLNGK